MRTTPYIGFAGLAIMLTAPWATADQIDWNGHQYKDVYIRATESMLYIMRPDSGDIVTLRRAEVPDTAWQLAEDAQERDSLLAAWNTSRSARQPHVAKAPEQAPVAKAAPEDAPPARGRERSGDQVPFLKLKGVPLGQALQATLRPMNLDYSVEDGYIYVSSPERLRNEARQSISTRSYGFSGLLDTLPKIVMQSSGVTSAYGQSSFGGGAGGFGNTGGFQTGSGGFSQGGFGQGGFGQGGFGGMGQGGGGYGGGFNQGGMGLQPDVTVISNISDMFSTIDDRRVGEPLAVIGTGLFFDPTPRNKNRR